MEKIKVGIIGGAGYTGGELIRLLIHHQYTTVSFIHSRSNAGKPIYSVHQDLLGDTELNFTNELSTDIDVLFLCLGHGESTKFLTENKIPENIKIIDLANDFRLTSSSKFGKRNFVYGLPELNRQKIKSAKNIANPGCFATTLQLGLLPLAKAGSHFSGRAKNIQAYKTLTHQHLGEIGESLLQLQPKKNIDLNFVPWRGDFTRGIFISSTLHCDLSIEEVFVLFKKYYNNHPFTHVSKEPIFLKQVVNTNKAMIQIEKAGSKLVIHSIADNLLKGASGQAVQNMNLMFGLDETTGLKLKANYF